MVYLIYLFWNNSMPRILAQNTKKVFVWKESHLEVRWGEYSRAFTWRSSGNKSKLYQKERLMQRTLRAQWEVWVEKVEFTPDHKLYELLNINYMSCSMHHMTYWANENTSHKADPLCGLWHCAHIWLINTPKIIQIPTVETGKRTR